VKTERRAGCRGEVNLEISGKMRKITAGTRLGRGNRNLVDERARFW
jgi:hypothetical protein